MVNRNNRKYILTLEKFKSNILSKLYKATLHHSGLKKFLNQILENDGIQLSELTDEYFKYIPVSKVTKGKKEIEIKEEEYKIVDENNEYIDGSIEEGDFLVEDDGYVHKVESLRSSYGSGFIDLITTDLMKIIITNIHKFFKIPKKYSNDLILYDYNFHSHSLKVSGDQVWKYKSKGELKVDLFSNITPLKGEGIISSDIRSQFIRKYGLKQLIKYYKYDFEYKDSDIVFGFDLTNTIQYYSKGSDVKLQELKESSDYVIIFDMEKAIENLSNVEDKRKDRETGKKGSLHFMTRKEILKMNKDRLISKLASRYKISEESLSDIKKYTDFEKILKKVFEKNPVLVLSDRNMISDIKNMVRILLKLPEYVNKPSQKGILLTGIKELNETYERIIKNPLVLYKLNIFEGSIFEETFKSIRFSPHTGNKIEKNLYYNELIKVDKELDKLRKNIKSYINNFEYENLNDVLAIFVKMNSYREAAEKLDFFLHNLSVHHGPDTSKDQLEYQYIRSISQNIPYRMESLDKYIEDIKTLSKLW